MTALAATDPGFWLVVAMFALGAAWPITAAVNKATGWLAARVAAVHADRDTDNTNGSVR